MIVKYLANTSENLKGHFYACGCCYLFIGNRTYASRCGYSESLDWTAKKHEEKGIHKQFSKNVLQSRPVKWLFFESTLSNKYPELWDRKCLCNRFVAIQIYAFSLHGSWIIVVFLSTFFFERLTLVINSLAFFVMIYPSCPWG